MLKENCYMKPWKKLLRKTSVINHSAMLKLAKKIDEKRKSAEPAQASATANARD